MATSDIVKYGCSISNLLRLRCSLQRSLQAFILGLQLLFGLTPFGVEWDAVYWADLLALRFVVVTHAFGAFVGVDFVDVRAHVNGVVRALGLAHVAINTFICNE